LPIACRRCHAWLFAIAVAVLAIGADAQEDRGVAPKGDKPQTPSGDDPSKADDGLAYTVVFEGMSSETRTKEILELVSETNSLADRPPTSFSRLRRRVEGDVPRLLQALRARGNYAAKVDVDIDRSTSPITVTFAIDLGPVYDVANVVIELDPPTEDELILPPPKELKLIKGERASSNKIIDAETTLLEKAKSQGFANAELGKRRIVVDHNTATMDVTFRLAPGPKLYFGETAVDGNADVEARYVTARLYWKPGDLVTPKKIEETQLGLIESGLFNSVSIETGKEPDTLGRVPVRIEVKETKHRSIEAGVRFRTDEGPGGSLGWEHRNLLGTGEQLSLEVDGSQLGWSLNGQVREPDFLYRGTALVIGAEVAIENTDAFQSESIGTSTLLERSIAKGMDISGGVAFRALNIEQAGNTESFGLLSFPANYNWDHSDNLLDPTRGGRLSVRNEPFVDVFGNDVAFNKTSIGYTRYLRLRKDRPSLTLAGRAKAGFLFGAARNNVPADERFYAGGGGSIRGYRFQLAGELDEDSNPVGGRSLVEFAGEIRSGITETLGAAIFADSGAATDSTVPNFEEGLFIGVGGGLRYFSPIGPIRLDVGVPLDRRSSDDAFQLYVSIGQAF
jgi:translocation and assembly module TamA